MSLNIPTKSTGDEVTAVEINEMVSGINSNLDANTVKKSNCNQLYTPFGNSGTASKTGFWSWFYYGSKGNITFLENQGVGGDGTQDMIDRIANIPSDTTLCTVMEGTNDAGAGVTALVHAQNMKIIFDNLIGRGINPVLILPAPRDSAAITLMIRTMSLYDWVTARNLGMMCFNPFDQLSDGYGYFKAGLSSDGLHPDEPAEQTAGDTLWGMYSEGGSTLPLNTNNNYGLIVNSLFMTDATSDGKPDGWATGGGTGHVMAPTSLGVGNTYTSTGLNDTTYAYTAFTVVQGNRYIIGAKVAATFTNNTSGVVQMYIEAPSTTKKYLIQDCIQDITDATVSLEFDADEAGDWKVFYASQGSNYQADISIAQVTLIDITAHTL